MIIDKGGLTGRFFIELLDAETHEVIEEWKIDNMLTDLPRQRYLKQLAGDLSDLKLDDLAIRYIAIGDGITAPKLTDRKLGNERYRQQVTAKTVGEDRLTTTVSISPFQTAANFHIRELGVFCGRTASSAKDSGLLLARVLVDIEKNSNTILNIMRQDIVTLN